MVKNMKNFKQFLSESITINGDFNGTLNVGGSEPQQQQETYSADIVWEGKMYRLEVEGKILSKKELPNKFKENILVQWYTMYIQVR